MSCTATMNFTKESSCQFNLGISSAVNVFKHKSSSFRLIFVDSPGPLCSATICLPTQSNNDKGLPHTLEHLIFCGSKGTPFRGYLDNLATRALSNGTNAYTTEDHTAYQITTAGSEGMSNVFPVFMDHVLNPTLTQSQYLTEVYHLDGTAKHQGVVYCEMASREQTDSDIMDLEIRKLAFPGTTYAFECGGLTKDIQKLNLDEIKVYHKKYYHLDNVTAILCGSFDIPQFLSICDFENIGMGSQEPMQFSTPSENTTKRLFPSEDTETGSIAYAWRGPDLSDVKAHTVIDILVRYFADSSASPLNQTFVEIKEPLATEVNMDIRPTVKGLIMCVFRGVPHEVWEDENSEESEIEESENESQEESDGSEDNKNYSIENESDHDAIHQNYFEPGYFNKLVTTCLIDSTEIMTLERIHSVLNRYVRKIYEQVEDDPHEALLSFLLNDVLSNSYSDTKEYGTRSNILQLCKDLASEDITFWKSQAKKWIIDNPKIEVMCVPSAELADKINEKEDQQHERRKKKLGEKGLEKLRKQLEQAVYDNRIHIPEEIIKKMPPLPDVTKLNYLKSTVDYVHVSNLPFNIVQHIKVDTSFTHLKIGLDITQIPGHLHPYLVLFQQLLFETPIKTVEKYMEHTDVVRYSQDIMVSHDVSLGFGNDQFTTGWLSSMFIIQCTTTHYQEAAQWIVSVLHDSIFTKERTETVIKNLIGSLPEFKRDGSSMLSSVVARISGQAIDKDISLFKQEGFLKDLLKREWTLVQKDLEAVREGLLSTQLGFAQVSTNVDNDIAPFMSAWRKRVSALNKSPFPMQRCDYAIIDIDPQFKNALIVPISGLQTSFINMIVPCYVSKKEHAAILVLIEIFSRTEGPLYTRIRGKGLAYGCSIHYSLWYGQLVFDCSEVSDPFLAVNAFWDVLKDYTYTDFDAETAKAGVLFRLIEAKSTVGGLLYTSLRNALRDGEIVDGLEVAVSNVDEKALKYVFDKFFVQFFDPKVRLTVMTTVPGEVSEKMCETFMSGEENRIIEFRKTSLKELKL